MAGGGGGRGQHLAILLVFCRDSVPCIVFHACMFLIVTDSLGLKQTHRRHTGGTQQTHRRHTGGVMAWQRMGLRARQGLEGGVFESKSNC